MTTISVVPQNDFILRCRFDDAEKKVSYQLLYSPHFFTIMQIEILKSNVHQATNTEANYYVGNLTLEEDLTNAVCMSEHEKIHVVNTINGERLETYLNKGKRGSGV